MGMAAGHKQAGKTIVEFTAERNHFALQFNFYKDIMYNSFKLIMREGRYNYI